MYLVKCTRIKKAGFMCKNVEKVLGPLTNIVAPFSEIPQIHH